MTSYKPSQLHSLLGSTRWPILVEHWYAEFLLDSEVLLDDALFTLARFARLAHATLGAKLTDAHVESRTMNHAALVFMRALLSALGTGFPLATTEVYQIGRAVLASRGSDIDGLLAIMRRFAEEDQAASREVACIADFTDREHVSLGRADQLQFLCC